MPALPIRSHLIVALGEAMVELAPTGQTDRFALGFAGDTLNTAWYLRRLLGADWQVDYATALGTDAMSDRMAGFIAGAGLGTGRIRRLAGRSVGLYLIELAAGERSFAYWRGQSAARLLADDPAALARMLHGAGLVYLSGITLAILEGGDRDTLLRALDAARAGGALVAFDPNLRPRLWPDSATMCRAVMQAAARADILLPSHDDEAAHFGDADPEATARRYAGAGAPLVVVKNGAGAMTALDRGALSTLQPDPVPAIVDTTAAGDSFNAGFLAAHLTGRPLAQAMAEGAALAAKVIAARGALVAAATAKAAAAPS
ncbi:sugar kinase [Paracoccaceae bacterium Fryx2]|nr:sugar kinase [Paracoccaceae bacterium Fryx2]